MINNTLEKSLPATRTTTARGFLTTSPTTNDEKGGSFIATPGRFTIMAHQRFGMASLEVLGT
jgi:hypothetical protein